MMRRHLTFDRSARSDLKKQARKRVRRMARTVTDQGQSALVLVLGIVLLLTLGAGVLVQTTVSTDPLVSTDFVQHFAYRALESGLNSYYAALNANPDLSTCSSVSTSTLCSQLTYEKWSQVPDTSTGAGGLPEYYLFGNPQYVFGPAPANEFQYLKVQVWGAAGHQGHRVFESSYATFKPQNGFLQNLYFTNFNAFNEAGHYGSCKYDYKNAYRGPGGSCVPVYFGPSDVINGPVFSNDSIYVSGTTGHAPAFTRKVTTADPTCQFVGGTSGACSNPYALTSVPNVLGANPETVPPTNTTIATQAKLGGCYYVGPTTITLNGSNVSISSPDTAPVGGHDATNQVAANTSTCPIDGSSVPISDIKNGVIYVDQSTTNIPGANPFDDMANNGTYAQNTYNSYTGSAPALPGFCVRAYSHNNPCYYGATDTPDIEGDAFVHGNLSGLLMVAAANDVIIDGSITYHDCVNPNGGFKSTVANPCVVNGGTGVNDALGLTANNYVEVSHPVYDNNGYITTDPTCGPGAPAAPLCDPGPITIDAAILALKQSFLVNNYDINKNGDTSLCTRYVPNATEGALKIYGVLDQYARGPVACSGETGYAKNYNWDSRLGLVTPPSYQTPSTVSFDIGSSSVGLVGACTVLPAPYSGPTVTFSDTCPSIGAG